MSDVAQLQRLLEAYLEIPKQSRRDGGGIISGRSEISTLEAIIQAYGASGHEEAVRKAVVNRLDPRLQKMVQTDAVGNLVLHLGNGKRDEDDPRIAIVAHIAMIGYEVKEIEDNGRLQVDVVGGGYTQYFLGHVVLLHKKDGSQTGGVLELPMGWEKAGYVWPSGPRSMDEPAHVYVGTRSKEETEAGNCGRGLRDGPEEIVHC